MEQPSASSLEERDRERDRVVAEIVKEVREYMLVMDKLISSVKPCPFCGEKKLFGFQEMKGAVYVVCDNCLANGPYCKTAQIAVDAWNKRPPLSPADSLES